MYPMSELRAAKADAVAGPAPVSTAHPTTVASPRARPRAGWVAVAVALALLVAAAVTWRATSSHENQTTNGTLLGAPANVIGYDYERPSSTIWLSISGPRATSVNGDRYSAGCASQPPQSSDPPPACSPSNPDRDPRGHLFVVRVARSDSQRPLVISAVDPQLADNGSSTVRGCRAANPPAVSAVCPSDIAGHDPSMKTTFIVRAPDSTPDDPVDNPAVCAVTFSDSTPEGVRNSDPWTRLCRVPADKVVPGDFVIQVRTDADLSSPRESRSGDLTPPAGAGSLERSDPNATGDGQNHFALRAEWDGGADETRSKGLLVDSLGHATMFTNQTSKRVAMQLTSLLSTAAGRTLRITVFDLGDVPEAGPQASRGAPQGAGPGGGLDIRVLPPIDSRVDGHPLHELTGCAFRFEEDPADQAVGSQGKCALEGVDQARFNGRLVTVDVPIPAGYTCESSLSGCWVSVQINYPGSPVDTATWTAELVDPVAGAAPAPPGSR